MKKVLARPPGDEAFPFFVHETGDAYISKKIERAGVWEPFESKILLSLLGDGDQVIDVGANIGWYAVSCARRVAPSGHVFAFEPDETNFAILCRNVGENAPTLVTSERTALGRGAGTATIQHSADNLGDHRIRAFVQHGGERSAEGAVPVRSLDDYLDASNRFQLERLRVLKIDVQGFEAEVMQGAGKLLAAMPERAFLFIEFDPALLNECNSEACGSVLTQLAAMHRKIYALMRPVRRLRSTSIDELRDRISGSQGSVDLILAHPNRVAELMRTQPMASQWLSKLF
jgi:FkbM family methyltransferase